MLQAAGAVDFHRATMHPIGRRIVTVRIGAKVPNSGPLPTEIGIAAMARTLEQAGFESLWVSDHVVFPEQIDSRYPFAADGRATWATSTPYFDAVVALALIAGRRSTSRSGRRCSSCRCATRWSSRSRRRRSTSSAAAGSRSVSAQAG